MGEINVPWWLWILIFLPGIIMIIMFVGVYNEREVLSKTISEIKGDTKDTVGKYNENRGIILIYTKMQSNQKLQETAMHEVCHNFWFTYLDFNQRLNYTCIFHNASYFVSDYARTETTEDFAESCAYYILGVKLDPKRQSFMDRTVKSNFRVIK
jgi:hypothetical protein